MTHVFSGLVVAAAAGAASFWGVLTHPVMPHASTTPPYMATTTHPAFATSSMPMHPPFMRGSTTPPENGWGNASNSPEHMQHPVPFMDHRFASSTASTTRPRPMPHPASSTGDRATGTPHLPPKHIETNVTASTSASANGGFWQRLFRFF
jgi:hypothetical protein